MKALILFFILSASVTFARSKKRPKAYGKAMTASGGMCPSN